MDIIYQITSIIPNAIILLVMIGGALIYIIRKNDKVKDIYGKMPTLKENTESITDLKHRVKKIEGDLNTAFEKLDLRALEIKETRAQLREGFGEIKIANSLVLEGILALIGTETISKDNETLTRFKEKIADQTIIVVKGLKERN